MQTSNTDREKQIKDWLSGQNCETLVVSIDTKPYLVSTQGILTARTIDCCVYKIDHNPPGWLVEHIQLLETA
jgi:hypothetical protein